MTVLLILLSIFLYPAIIFENITVWKNACNFITVILCSFVTLISLFLFIIFPWSFFFPEYYQFISKLLLNI